MKSRVYNVRFLVTGALIAAIYVIITGIFAPISFGLVQLRISEAMYILALFEAAAVPGLTVGCLICNLLWTPFGLIDIVLGTLATALGVLFVRKMRAHRTLSLLGPVVTNGLLIPVVLIIGGVESSYLLGAVYIAAGEGIACYGLGLPLCEAVERVLKQINRKNGD